MAEIVNLRMARKARARAAGQTQAAQNRALHGQAKGDRQAAEAETARTARTLDNARRDHPQDAD
ncbi:DUF4169 family protein [Novosphingobium beihaiensis]|uniref:DUF4169 family protein n=1 Tax=Novosphingobium beihaiensis TaxID=2930389 RepID=A0ABT0BTE7_9SPHN|nr:DUF4169 family protein [Novosphingobium beihaiensis]MCJ2188331.1 DUF4169 family protein [Novosphingobium beihaiensis]